MAVLEDIDPESWLTREVYANFGLALYMAQVLEHGIINLVTWSGIADGTYREYDETEAAFAELARQTMGTLKKTLLLRRADVTHLEELLIRAVRLRNFLAHEYFRQRSAAIMTEEGRRKMIAELRAARDFFQDVDSGLEPLTRKILSAIGVDRHIPEMMEEARQQGFGDPLPGLLKTQPCPEGPATCPRGRGIAVIHGRSRASGQDPDRGSWLAETTLKTTLKAAGHLTHATGVPYTRSFKGQ